LFLTGDVRGGVCHDDEAHRPAVHVADPTRVGVRREGDMRWWKRVPRLLGAAALATAVVVAPVATSGNAAADVVRSTSGVAPALLTSGRTAFYTATWTNTGNATLTNPVAVITLPAGSALVSPTPPACTAATRPGSVVVSCPQNNVSSGAAVTQQLLVTMSAPATTATTVTAVLTADEKGSDQNKSHQDTFLAPPQSITIVAGAADAAGGCLRNGDGGVATRGDVPSIANPLITTATLAGPSGVPLCVPVTVRERAATSSADSCGAGARCTTDVAVTESDISTVSDQAPASPVQLTFSVLASSKNLTWYKDGVAVADCPGAAVLPAQTVNACVNSRSKTGSTVRLGVLWRAGPDPSWRG
jgi:uncharacterized repeat protein (TIGR01451 family)